MIRGKRLEGADKIVGFQIAGVWLGNMDCREEKMEEQWDYNYPGENALNQSSTRILHALDMICGRVNNGRKCG